MIYRLDAADAAICDIVGIVFFFKQKTAYELRISDWSSDVCSSDLKLRHARRQAVVERRAAIDDRIVQGHTKTGVPEAVLKREFPAVDRRLLVAVDRSRNLEIDEIVANHAQAVARGYASSSEERRVGKECGCTWKSRWWRSR